ncbi:ChrR family anti-sigma-E factor [Mesorhizobium sp. LHD-90]|uniref:ChrR family anti-sigma-E factor n=1 Tax=Mesorhizobium sp. LHD-90 TaxID=3071414 RepID=UPI0027E1D9BC|nr:ChrR family anti-sigma-E factor [Mesorhizobium sp. LHD-90]MDQ6432951.1 ChrR family anti-sigma-E factor [Mesorhizobium sp. LHD-90]
MVPDISETLDALLARYVAGSLPAPVRVLVESHLAIKPESRAFVSRLEVLAGGELTGAEPVPLGGRQDRLDAIFASPAPAISGRRNESPGILPRPLVDFVGFEEADIPWRTKLPGFKEYALGEIDGCNASLFWLRPGRAIPDHTHDGSELFLVLDGAFNDQRGRFARGDISIADETVDHRPVAETDRPCIGFLVSDGGLRLTGPLHRKLTDIVGF